MATTDGQVLATALLALCGVLLPGASGAAPLRVLCTTFPMYQLTRNVGQGREGLAVSLLLPAQLGCPHDYVCFEEQLEPLVANIHGQTTHKGKRPRTAGSRNADTQTQLIRLRRELREAVQTEDYERASVLRDEIRCIEREGTPSLESPANETSQP